MKRRLLIVDDEEIVRTSLTRLLEAAGYECEAASDAAEAREKIATGFFELMLCDIKMPGDSGIELLRQISAQRMDVAIVLLAGEDDPEVAREAIELDAYGYLVKPFTPNEILITVINALSRMDLERERRVHAEELETKLTDRTYALNRAVRRLHEHETEDELPWREPLERLARALARREEETVRHIERVGLYCELLADKAGTNGWAPGMIRRASMLHDVGKIGIPDAILTKRQALLPEEMDTVRRHCDLGYQLLTGSESPLLDLAASIALTHHERWDSSGYPRALAGDEIPIEGRIVAVADVFDAMTSARPYRPPLPVDEVLATMGRESGAGFDPRLIDLFFESLSEFMAVRDQHPDGDFGAAGIKVLVVDDQELFAQGLRSLFEGASGISVVGTTSSAKEAVRIAVEKEPDVVVLDWLLRDSPGAVVARSLLSKRPSTRIVVLAGHANENVVAEAIDAGCSAVLAKGRAFEEIVEVIRAARAGEVTIPLATLSSVVGRLRSPRAGAAEGLTARELEILARLAEGLSDDAIAELLSLSSDTVRKHVQRIITKMEAHSKLETVTKGLLAGLITVPPRFATL